MSSNSDQREKDKAATEWFTKPVYKILIVGLVLLELLGKEMEGGIRQFFHIVLWIGLGLIVVINILSLFLRTKPSEKDQTGEE
jgi:hypothetical protein